VELNESSRRALLHRSHQLHHLGTIFKRAFDIVGGSNNRYSCGSF
jgi:hypothetical protein